MQTIPLIHHFSYRMMRKIYTGLIIVVIGLLAASCRQQKELIYFPELGETGIQNYAQQDQKEYRIRANDILYVQVMSLDDRMNQMFNAASTGGANTTARYFSEDAMYFTGFSVQKNGMVDLPVLGEIEVKGKTEMEAKEAIIAGAGEYLKDAEVIVKLANFKITLLGEVKRPGTYTYYNNQTTILEALGKAGDLTDYGDRQQVLIIRPTLTGSETYRINLQDEGLLASPEYFVQPNDVIYVSPLKAKGTRLLAQDYGIFITSISSTLTAVSLIVTLILSIAK